MFYNQAKKLLATGLGLAVLTKEKAEEMVQEWVQEGELSKDEGKELIDNWVRKVDSEREEVRTRIQREVNKIVDSAGAASQEELDALKAEFRTLEQRVQAIEDRLFSQDEE